MAVMSRRWRRFLMFGGTLGGVVAVAAGAAPVGAATGNGIASQSPTQTLQAAAAAMNQATSVTITGGATSSLGELQMSVKANKQGDASGTLGIPSHGITVRFVSLAGTVYIKASSSFYTLLGMSQQQAAKLSATWISAPASDPKVGSVGQTVSLGQIESSLVPNASDAGIVVTKAVGTIGRQPVVRITATNSKTPKDNGVVYVAATGQPYIVRLVGRGKSNVGVLNLTNWNVPVHVQAPQGAVSASSVGL